MAYKTINKKLEEAVKSLAPHTVSSVFWGQFGTQAVVRMADGSTVIMSSDQGHITKIVPDDDVMLELRDLPSA